MTQLVPSLAIERRTKLVRTRELPVPGKATVKVGDYLSPDAVVTRGEIPGEIVVVNPVDELGMPFAALKDAYRVRLQESVAAGTVLVSAKFFFGLVKSEVLAPVSGTIAFITSDQGRIGIQIPPTKAERIAYCGGRVIGVDDVGAVELETEATLVQGIFGVGGERVGKVHKLSVAVDKVIELTDLPADCSKLIIVGGMSPAIGVLEEAQRRGAVGFVSGSITSSVLRRFVGEEIGVAVTGDEDVTMSLVITEGFGDIPMSQRVFDVLGARHGSLGGINGTTQVRAGAVRPEIVVPFSEEERAKLGPLDAEGGRGLPLLEIGRRVRIIRYPLFGELGVVQALPEELTVIETGAALRVTKITLEDGREVVVPRSNIELL